MAIDLNVHPPIVVTAVKWAKSLHTLDNTGLHTSCGVTPPFNASCLPTDLYEVTCHRCINSGHATLHPNLHRPMLDDGIIGAVVHALSRVDKDLTPIDFHCDVMATDEAGSVFSYEAGTCGHDEAHVTTADGELIHIDHEARE